MDSISLVALAVWTLVYAASIVSATAQWHSAFRSRRHALSIALKVLPFVVVAAPAIGWPFPPQLPQVLEGLPFVALYWAITAVLIFAARKQWADEG